MSESMQDLAVRISVIVPCHNSRRDYLDRVLAALRAQTLPKAEWELVVVDNASNPPLSEWVDVSWHEHGRIVRELTPGLTPARLRGFAETSAPLIVMVDDDNVLDADYLAHTLQIANQIPVLGAFGGSIEPVFDEPPPEWTRPHWPCVAIWPCMRSVWSNDLNHWESTPSGAGMCLQRAVAERYAQDLVCNPLRKALDRCGESLVSGGDTDIAWTACSMGFGMGRFRELRLLHLIPPGRLTPHYLRRMYEGKGYSTLVLNTIWKRNDPTSVYEGFLNLLRAGLRRVVSDFRNRDFLAAKRRGEAMALSTLDQLSRDVHVSQER